MSVAAADALIDACQFQPDQLPAAMQEIAHLLGYDYFCLVTADLTQSRFIASDCQRKDIAACFSGGWSDVDCRVNACTASRSARSTAVTSLPAPSTG